MFKGRGSAPNSLSSSTAAKKHMTGSAKPHGAKRDEQGPLVKKKTHNSSALKGPVVAHASGPASRDSANDRRCVPFASKQEERAYQKAKRIPRYAPPATPATTTTNTKTTNTTARPRGASSAAQRRAILKTKGDDDVLAHFRSKLSASTFRLLNEQIYSSPLAFASQLLGDASTYADYHQGYSQQLQQWPMKPSQVIVEALLGDRRGRFLANKAKSMPGYIPTSWVVADMGCGDAQIAQALRPKGYTVHSFDFCASNEFVTVANAANVPLESNSVDICIFSLSLMATDYIECLYEAFRILKPKRLLKIVEVRSRVPHPKYFADLVEGIGFDLDYQDTVTDYFIAYDFLKRDGQAKANKQPKHDPQEVLVASLYKKR